MTSEWERVHWIYCEFVLGNKSCSGLCLGGLRTRNGVFAIQLDKQITVNLVFRAIGLKPLLDLNPQLDLNRGRESGFGVGLGHLSERKYGIGSLSHWSPLLQESGWQDSTVQGVSRVKSPNQEESEQMRGNIFFSEKARLETLSTSKVPVS